MNANKIRPCWFVVGLTLLAATLCVSSACADDEKKAPAESAPPVLDQATLEKKFEETLSGCQMIGVFTVTGQDKDKPLNEDKYTIDSVKKMKNDYWVFEARIQYNNQDTKMRMPLQVKWAGDTPVITLTKILVPGMGTFSARVLIYENEYAGTWSAGDHGGHMFGRIEKLGSKSEEKTVEKSAAKPDGEKK